MKPRQLAYDICRRVQTAAVEKKIPVRNLRAILQGLGYAIGTPHDEYEKLRQVFDDRLEHLLDAVPVSLMTLFDDPYGMSKSRYLDIAASHGISCAGTRDDILESIVDHFRHASCVSASPIFSACEAVAVETPANETNGEALQGYLFASVASHIRLKPLKALLRQHSIEHDPDAHFSVLRRKLKAHARKLLKGKRVDAVSVLTDPSLANNLHKVRNQWPRKISDATKDNISSLFRESTNSEALAEATCASCAESCLVSAMNIVDCSSINMDVFRKHDGESLEDTVIGATSTSQTVWIDEDEYYLDRAGVIFSNDAPSHIRLCRGCEKEVRLEHIPRLSLAKWDYFGRCTRGLERLDCDRGIDDCIVPSKMLDSSVKRT